MNKSLYLVQRSSIYLKNCKRKNKRAGEIDIHYHIFYSIDPKAHVKMTGIVNKVYHKQIKRSYDWYFVRAKLQLNGCNGYNDWRSYVLPVPNFSLCHWSSQLFDLRAPSSTDVPFLLLNQPTELHTFF